MDIRDPLSRFLLEFAKQLLRSGISLPDFQSLAERAFVLAAAEACRFQTRRPNKSAVAAMTGLTRAQVRLVLSAETAGGLAARAQIWSVIEGWQTDPSFLTRAGKPKLLSANGKNSEFSLLTRRYSRDIPPRAVFEEMKRRGLLVSKSGKIRLVLDEGGASVERVTGRLLKTLETIVASSAISHDELRGVFFRAAEIEVPAGVSGKLIRRRVQESATNFIETSRTAAVALSGRTLKNKNNRRTKVVALLIESQTK